MFNGTYSVFEQDFLSVVYAVCLCGGMIEAMRRFFPLFSMGKIFR